MTAIVVLFQVSSLTYMDFYSCGFESKQANPAILYGLGFFRILNAAPQCTGLFGLLSLLTFFDHVPYFPVSTSPISLHVYSHAILHFTLPILLISLHPHHSMV